MLCLSFFFYRSFCYTLSIDNGTLQISSSGILSIDWEQENVDFQAITQIIILDVVEINSTFSYFYNLEKLSLSSPLYRIRDYSFSHCCYLKTVSIPSSLSLIGSNAFSNCFELSSIELDCNAQIIPESCFANCFSLKTITFPQNLSMIGNFAFQNCGSLTFSNLPVSLQIIQEMAFVNCTQLASILIPKNVESISPTAFLSCLNITSFSVDNENQYFKSQQNIIYDISSKSILFYPISNDVTTFSIPETVELMNDFLFYECQSLSSVMLSPSIHKIGQYTFFGCINLISIDLTYVTEIGDYAFSCCSSLKSVQFGKQIEKIGNYSFSYDIELERALLPETITSLGDDLFLHCVSLQEISYPAQLSYIPFECFAGCKKLKSFTFSPNIETINENAFTRCRFVEKFDLPSNLQTIGSGAFSYCKNLTTFTIPKSVTSIGDSIFYKCRGLLSIDIKCEIDNILDYTFTHCSSLETVDLPSISSIGNFSFYECSALQTISLPSSITEIGSYAFCNCTSLISITLPVNMTSIGEAVFANCSSLQRFDIDSSNMLYCSVDGILYDKNITSIIAFPSSYQLSYVIPDSVSIIGSYSFFHSNIHQLDFSNIEYILEFAFHECRNLQRITLSNKLQFIGEYSFSDCINLEMVHFECQTISIPFGAFSGCSSLNDIILPDNTTYIDDYAFSGCSSLNTFTLPLYLNEIGSYVFSFSENLETIYFDGNLEPLCYEDTFYNTSHSLVINSSLLNGIYCGISVQKSNTTSRVCVEKSSSGNDKKSSSGSSNKEECTDVPYDRSKDWSRKKSTEVKTVYLGANAIVDFQAGYKIMKAARNVLGRLIPPPQFQHTALWVSDDDSSDDSIGTFVVYGHYESNDYASYLSHDGAKAYLMTLEEFKKSFNLFEVKKLNPARNMTLGTFIDKVKRSGEWKAANYDWKDHNCQHFTATCLDILGARRCDAKENDWKDLPRSILNSLKKYES